MTAGLQRDEHRQEPRRPAPSRQQTAGSSGSPTLAVRAATEPRYRTSGMDTTTRRQTTVTAADGTPLAVHTHGEPGRPVVVLTNGIGTTENFWRFIVEDLRRDHFVAHWDYRGHGHTPPSRAGDYSMATMTDDLGRVTRAVQQGGAPPIHIAFSMGVAVLLEFYRRDTALVRAMALIAGSPDAPGTGTGLFRVPGVQQAVRGAVTALTPVVPLLAPAVHAFLRSRAPIPFATMLGVLQPDAPRKDMDQFLEGVAGMDPVAYWKTLASLLGQRGSDVLPSVSVPTAIVAAAKDQLMPLAQVEALRRGLPHARFTLVERAGHAGLVERGPQMAQAVRELVDAVAAR